MPPALVLAVETRASPPSFPPSAAERKDLRELVRGADESAGRAILAANPGLVADLIDKLSYEYALRPLLSLYLNELPPTPPASIAEAAGVGSVYRFGERYNPAIVDMGEEFGFFLMRAGLSPTLIPRLAAEWAVKTGASTSGGAPLEALVLTVGGKLAAINNPIAQFGVFLAIDEHGKLVYSNPPGSRFARKELLKALKATADRPELVAWLRSNDAALVTVKTPPTLYAHMSGTALPKSSVTAVSPFAPEARYSITGWLRSHQTV